MRHAATQLEPLSRCRRSHSGRKPGARTPGQNLLVAELSSFLGAQTSRYPGPRLETVARRRSRSALQRRKVLPLALVLEFWWGSHDRTADALDRRHALGHENGSASLCADARR